MNFYLTSLGCKLNQAEIETLAREIDRRGHTVVNDPCLADWAIINTCTVTHVAAQKSRQLVRHLHRTNAALHIAVTGCYAEIAPADLRSIEGIALVVPNTAKNKVVERILALVLMPCVDSVTPSGLVPRRLSLGHTRAFVKIQDGCDNRCSYCIVSVARGRQRSRPPEEVLGEVRARIGEGYKEIVLTGVHIGAYGRDSALDAALPPSQGWSLARLVQVILAEQGNSRLRLSSIEPWDLDEEFLALWANARLCRHIHLPLQSGCDDTLRRMQRRYTTQRFAELVARIRQRIPDVALTTDIIVGFPGESEREFEETRAFVERMNLARLHVFKFSRRPGTLAADMLNQVDPAIAQARSEALITLGRRIAQSFHARFVHTDVDVLFESADNEGEVRVWSGLTDNYLRIWAPSPEELSNTLATVHCLEADETGLRGELAPRRTVRSADSDGF